jgi:hypothetical protein
MARQRGTQKQEKKTKQNKKNENTELFAILFCSRLLNSKIPIPQF